MGYYRRWSPQFGFGIQPDRACGFIRRLHGFAIIPGLPARQIGKLDCHSDTMAAGDWTIVAQFDKPASPNDARQGAPVINAA